MLLVLTERRWLRFSAFSAFYFAQGVPIGLLMVAIPAWLAEHDASRGDIALFASVVSIPWAFKLVAGPFMDRFTFLPMGFRRPWVLVAQGGLTLSLLVVAFAPLDVASMAPLMAVGFLANAFAATQDVAVDGMAIDVLPVGERGRANAFMAFGQVAGSSSFGALCGTLLPMVGLTVTASICAVTVAIIFVFVAVVRERPGERLMPWTMGDAAARMEVTALKISDNLLDLFRVLVLPMSVLLLVVSFAYFLRGGIVTPVFTTFAVQELGLTGAQYSQFSSAMSLIAALMGVALGPFIDRLGAKRFLMGALIAGTACHLAAALLADRWPDLMVFGCLAAASYVVGQLVFVTIIALFMNLCWTKVAATQFAIYMALANVAIASGGFLFFPVADKLSFGQDFLIMAVLFGIAASALMFFKEGSHARRLEELMAEGIRRRGST